MGQLARAKNADANADNWLNGPGVRERIAELQEQTAEECGMERADCAKSLVAMYQSPPSAASMDNPLCDVVHTKSGPRPIFPSKIYQREFLVPGIPENRHRFTAVYRLGLVHIQPA